MTTAAKVHKFGAEISLTVSVRDGGQFSTGGQLNRNRYISLNDQSLAEIETFIDLLDEFLDQHSPSKKTCGDCDGKGQIQVSPSLV
jgi:hypothetical protein